MREKRSKQPKASNLLLISNYPPVRQTPIAIGLSSIWTQFKDFKGPSETEQDKTVELHDYNMEKVTKTIGGEGVVMFSKSSCCLCYTVEILLRELGVKPVIYEMDKDPEGREMEKALLRMGCRVAVPAVFIDGVLVGSTNEVISLHLRGNLSPKLKPYQSFN